MKKISVIIPVYNVEKYIQECIESIIKQDFLNIEILLIDDGSTDKSGEICDLYSKRYDFIEVIHEPNLGVCSARNKGISIAKGEYICFIDGDDFIEKKFFEVLYQECKNNNLDILFYNYILFENNNIIKKQDKNYLIKNNVINGLEYQKLRLKNGEWDNFVWMGLFKNEFLKKNKFKFYEKEKLLFEDILFTNEVLLKAERVKYIDFYGYMYRNRWQDSLSRQKTTDFHIYSYYNIMSEFIELYYESVDKNEKMIIIDILYNILTGLLETIHYSEERNKDFYYKKIKDTDILKILGKNLKNKKNFIKFILFNINLKLYYCIIDLLK